MSEVNTLKPLCFIVNGNDDLCSYVYEIEAAAKTEADILNSENTGIDWKVVPLYSMEWLPIELAPKGVDVLVCYGNGGIPFIAHLYDGDRWLDDDGGTHHPKYFMLLPEGKEDEA